MLGVGRPRPVGECVMSPIPVGDLAGREGLTLGPAPAVNRRPQNTPGSIAGLGQWWSGTDHPPVRRDLRTQYPKPTLSLATPSPQSLGLDQCDHRISY